jgi:hypothetical protein
MTAEQLQDLMDQAWALATADFDYDTDDLASYEQQDLNSRQDYYFEQLGGDLAEYRRVCIDQEDEEE